MYIFDIWILRLVTSKKQFSSPLASTRKIIVRAPDSVESLISDSPSDAAKAAHGVVAALLPALFVLVWPKN
jgi:hypothetical protein